MNKKRQRQFIIVLFIIGTSIFLTFKWLNYKNVPVFMYHCIFDIPYTCDKELFVTPQNFENQVKYWHDNGYNGIFAAEILNAQGYENPIVITFDDGYEDNYKIAYPILKKYNMKATIFVASKYIGTQNYLTLEEIKEMSDSGLISIQSHTVNHVDLCKIDDESLKKEFFESNKVLEEITGKKVAVLSYPYGFYNDHVMKIAKNYYDAAFTTFGAWINKSSKKMKLNRAGIFRSTTLEEVIEYTEERSKSRLDIFLKSSK